jgi:Tol biopolymer transport system component
MQLRAFPQSGQTVVERLDNFQPLEGQRWVIPNSGRSVSFSPDGQWIAWTAGQPGPPFDTALREIWVSRADGSQARQVYKERNGSFAGWFPDDRLLVSGRLESPEEGQAYWVLSLEETPGVQAGLIELARGGRLRGASISPDGTWMAYMVTSSEDPAQDGLWVVDTHTGQRRRLDLFGGYRWQDGDSLLVVPLDISQPIHQLWQVEAASGQSIPLTDPAVTPFKIANGDWSVSPDGQKIVFVSANDHNIWLLSLPEE